MPKICRMILFANEKERDWFCKHCFLRGYLEKCIWKFEDGKWVLKQK